MTNATDIEEVKQAFEMFQNNVPMSAHEMEVLETFIAQQLTLIQPMADFVDAFNNLAEDPKEPEAVPYRGGVGNDDIAMG